jgi:hypothetical protein
LGKTSKSYHCGACGGFIFTLHGVFENGLPGLPKKTEQSLISHHFPD